MVLQTVGLTPPAGIMSTVQFYKFTSIKFISIQAFSQSVSQYDFVYAFPENVVATNEALVTVLENFLSHLRCSGISKLFRLLLLLNSRTGTHKSVQNYSLFTP